MRQTTRRSAHRQGQISSPRLPLPAHIRLAIFDGSAVPQLTGYRWGQKCQSCVAHLVPTTVDPQDYRRCRFCRVLTVLLRERSREMFVHLWQYRQDWTALAKARAGALPEAGRFASPNV